MSGILERIRVIDLCLRDKSRVNSWKSLAESCADYSKEMTGKYKEVSRRTIMADIALMRSGKLGYEAPIDHSKERGYYYTIPDFTIHKINLSKKNIKALSEAFRLLKQLTNNERLFSIHKSLSLLEQVLHLEIDPQSSSVIYFEHSLNEPGQKWLDSIFEYTLEKKVIRIKYKAFTGEQTQHLVSPAFIKEYNNRWYLYGYDHERKHIINLSLDRFSEITPSIQSWYVPDGFNHESWFEHLYGVTKPTNKQPVKIVFKTTRLLASYMDTKPIHHLQKKIAEDDVSATYELYLYDNYEIRSKLRSFGSDLEVVAPEGLLHEGV
jgi:predicted DNA-binding transcriptional regulator YafY